MNEKQSWRDTPRELGKAAYREGRSIKTNPFAVGSGDSLSWAEGWIWCKVYFPRAEHVGEIDDPDFLEPNAGYYPDP